MKEQEQIPAFNANLPLAFIEDDATKVCLE
jgi:hypothetical protein